MAKMEYDIQKCVFINIESPEFKNHFVFVTLGWGNDALKSYTLVL